MQPLAGALTVFLARAASPSWSHPPSDGETTVKDSEPFPDMPTVIVTDDSDGGLPDHLLGDADLRSEYKRRLSFNAEHQRRLTFKRERAQSDASHKRGTSPSPRSLWTASRPFAAGR